MDAKHQQFNNQAFLPYAINGDETTYVPNGKMMSTLTDDCKDDGYVKPFLGAESSKNHEYENPAEVAMRAGLNRVGSGPRRKNNQLYEESKKMRVELPETPPSPEGTNDRRAEMSPLVITTLKEREQKKRCNPRFVILLILVFLLSAAALALSVMNILQKNDCLCASKDVKAAQVVRIDEKVNHYSGASLVNRLEELERQYKNLQDKLEKQSEELTRVNKSTSSKPKLLQGDQGVRGLPGPKGPQGPKGGPGLQGVKGIQGVPGIGNASRCSHKDLVVSEVVSTVDDLSTFVMIEYMEPQNAKVMSVTCSTTLKKGASDSYLRSQKKNGQIKYICDCAGVSRSTRFKPQRTIECVMHIWECPL